MPVLPRKPALTLLLAVLALAVGPLAQEAEKKDPSQRNVLTLKPERTIAFETTEGTWMNLDVSPDGKTIAFDLLGDIYTLPIGGGEATRLTSGMSFDIQPTYAPDGKTIAYISDRSGSDNIWMMSADGSNRRALTKERERALAGTAWAPDGDYVLTRRAGRLRLYHRDGGTGADVAKPADANGTGAVFSKDGKWIYFASRMSAPGAGGLTPLTSWQIRSINRSTGDVATVTVSPVGAFRPAISPDGKWLAFGVRLDAKTGLRLRNLETDEEDWLAYPIDRDNAERPGVLDTLPAYTFSPDGQSVVIAYGGTFHRIDVQTRQDTRIAFKAKVEQQLGPLVLNTVAFTTDPVQVRNVRYANGNKSGGPVVFAALNRIWRVDPGGTPQRVVEQPVAQFQPVLSPDGRSVVFVTWDDTTGGHVWKVALAAGEPQRLTTHAAYYLHPTWSVDGSRVAFIKEDPAAARNVWSRNSGQIMYVPADGGETQYVTSAPSDNRLTFSPDGTRIFFVTRGTPPAGPPPADGEPPRPTSEFVSVRLDGTDRRVVARIGADTTEVVPSPDGRWIAFTVREDTYLAALPPSSEPPTITETGGPGPVKRVTRDGGIDVHWEDGGRTLAWVFGNKLFRVDRDKAIAQSPSVAPAPKEGDAQAPAADAQKAPEGPKPDVITIPLTAPRRTPSGSVALKGANVITMKGTEVIRNATVLVKDNRIAEVGPAKSVRIPADARVVDVSGKTIVPGFIDMHAHLRPPRDVFVQNSWSYEANLAYGVTTTRDVSTSNDSFAYGELVEAGLLLGPRIFTTGRAMTTGNAKIENLDDARAIVRHYKQLGATVIKQYMQPHRRQRQWVIQAVREEGLNATNEGGGDLRLDLTMVLDGYSGFEHALPQADLYNDVVRLIAESKTWYTPTLVVAYGGPTAEWYFYQTTNVHDDAKLRRFTPHEVVDRRTRRGQMNALDEYHFIAVATNAANILKAGGNVAMGAHGEEQGICAHWEIWAMQMGGMSNFDALRTATTVAAEGLGAAADLGTIEAGKLADLLVLNRNPLENIRNTNTIALVMRNGDLFDGETLDMLWPEKVSFKPTWFRDYTVPSRTIKPTDPTPVTSPARAGGTRRQRP